jgi:AraC-like DNA-binding protein
MPPAYREFRPPAGLEAAVACLWENDAKQGRVQRVVPDGCLDLIWLADRELVIAGPDTGPRFVTLPARTRSSGIRLRPGAGGAFLGLPASEVRDQQVRAEVVFGAEAARLEDRLAAAGPAFRMRLLSSVVARRGVVPDPLVRAAARRLAAPKTRVAEVAAELGVSERQLHRRTVAAVGYGPKFLGRVARLRRLVALPDCSLAVRAFAAGYASQAHMSDEVRALTATTPVRFLEDASLTAA